MNSVIIGGDIVPTQSNMKYFEAGEMETIVSKDLLDTLNESEYRIFNLETPITDTSSPIVKEGPCFKTTTKSVEGLKSLRVDLVTLANNHILDQGQQGLAATLKALDIAGIAYVGVGENTESANNAYFFKVGGVTYGVYGCVEHEWTVATENKPGANPFDALEIADTIRRIKAKCDCLIVLYHGGKE